MVEAITFQTIFQFLQTAGLLIGITYYIMNLRNQEKARKIQTFLSIFNRMSNKETVKDINELMGMNWTDYNDFEMKYGSDVNPENRNLRYSYWTLMDGMGYLVKKGLIDEETIFSLNTNDGNIWLWDKQQSVIREIRKRYNMPKLGVYWEYMIEMQKDKRRKEGLDPTPPEKYGQYIPDSPT